MLKTKFLIGSLTALGGISFFAVTEEASAAGYNDSVNKSYFEKDLKKAIDNKYISVEALGVPNISISRAEFASLIYNASKTNEISGSEKKFTDVKTNHPYYREIQAASKMGLLAGYVDGSFKPDAKITREEMAILLLRYLEREQYSFENYVEKTKFSDTTIAKYDYIIQKLKNAEIIAGYADNTFKPYNNITREEAIALFLRAEKVIKVENTELTTIGKVTGDINVRFAPEFSATSFGVIKKDDIIFYNQVNENWAMVKFNGEIGYVYSQYVQPSGDLQPSHIGVAYAKQLINIYDENGSAITYVASGTELFITELDVANNKAYVEVGSFKGFVNYNEITYKSVTNLEDRSYYALNAAGEVVHYLFNNSTGNYSTFTLGKNNSALNLKSGVKYFSPKNFEINNSVVYPYYNYLPLRTESKITGSQIDAYIKSKSPNSPLIGLGEVFVEAAKTNNLNAMYLVANALHESAYGLSQIALDKKNLFGFKAYDASAYDSAANFTTLEEGIYYCAEFISTNYLNPSSWRYFGAVTGDKSVGMNVKYASDKDWGAKIAGHMYRMDKSIGFKDFGSYKYGEIKASTKVYSNNGSVVLTLKKDRIAAIQGEVTINGKEYFKVIADETSIGVFYVLKAEFKIYQTF